MAAKEIAWINTMMAELGIQMKTTKLKIDNQSAIRLIQNPEFHSRTKHIDVRMHYVRERYNAGDFEVDTTQQQADILTKSLTPKKHAEHVRMIGLGDKIKIR